jgi:hypothetical protein
MIEKPIRKIRWLSLESGKVSSWRLYPVLDAVRTNMTSENLKNFHLSIVREKLINVRPIFVLARYLSFKAKLLLFTGLPMQKMWNIKKFH